MKCTWDQKCQLWVQKHVPTRQIQMSEVHGVVLTKAVLFDCTNNDPFLCFRWVELYGNDSLCACCDSSCPAPDPSGGSFILLSFFPTFMRMGVWWLGFFLFENLTLSCYLLNVFTFDVVGTKIISSSPWEVKSQYTQQPAQKHFITGEKALNYAAFDLFWDNAQEKVLDWSRAPCAFVTWCIIKSDLCLL